MNSYLDANDCEVGLSTRYSPSAMAAEDILWDTRHLFILSIPGSSFWRYKTDV